MPLDEQYMDDLFQLKKLAEKEALLEAYLFLSVQLVWWIDCAITSIYSNWRTQKGKVTGQSCQVDSVALVCMSQMLGISP